MQLLSLREWLQQCITKQHSSKCRNSFCLLGKSLDFRHNKLYQVSTSHFNRPTSQYCFVHECDIDYRFSLKTINTQHITNQCHSYGHRHNCKESAVSPSYPGSESALRVANFLNTVLSVRVSITTSHWVLLSKHSLLLLFPHGKWRPRFTQASKATAERFAGTLLIPLTQA